MQQQLGSGKTAVLVERIIQKIINEKVDIDKILVVTFTNAAASEMKQRISDSIYKKIEQDPNNLHLQRQINLLGRASICTIHSFCLDVIKNNFFEIDISPNFRIGDTSEIELLKMECLEDIFEQKYEQNDEQFLKLVETYTGYRGDEPLKEIIQKVYNFIQSSPFPIKWLEENVEKFNVDLSKDFGQTKWGQILLDNFKEKLDEQIAMMQAVEKYLSQNYELEKWINTLKIDIQNMNNLKQNCNSWEEMYKSVEEFKFTRWPTDKKIQSNIKEEAKQKRDEITKNYKDIKNIMIAYTGEEINEDLKATYEIMKILKDLIIEFSNKFSQKKKEKNIIDFNDIEHFALKILMQEDENRNYVPTEVSKKYMQKFIEIAVDEYQDSNLVQEYILNAISKNNIFMVGDVKQSIYKFRQARPELFLEKYDRYKTLEDRKENDNLKIKLFKNFRSRKNVLDITNIIFKNIMSKDLGDINYTKEEYLNLGANYPENNQNLNIQLHIIDLKEDKKDEWDLYETENEEDEALELVEKNLLEAKFVAKKIKELLNSNYQVYDSKVGYRKATYKDIVILLRATSNIAQIYEKELLEKNIPIYSDTSSQYLESIEIQTIISLLKIIDNPMQDIDLVTVLRSMIGGFTDNELVKIRLVDKNCYFYESMQKAKIQVGSNLSNKIDDFFEKIQKWRQAQEVLGLEELIWKIYEDTGYYEYVSLMPNGALRQANLKMLFEKAKIYESASYSGLFNFINFIERLKQTSGDMSAAKIIGENEDVVRIMSIHKSKGLEFPIVFLANSSKQFNMMDLKDSIMLDQDLGIGPKYIDYIRKIEFNTMAKEAIKIKSRKEIISEEMRVLYVALTRAKEKLIITGTSKDLEKDLSKKEEIIQMCSKEKIDKYIVEKYISYLDWIELVYLKNKQEMEGYFELYKHTKKELLEENKEQSKNVDYKKQLEESIKNSKELDSKTKQKLTWKYPNEKLTKIESKTSVTGIKQLKKLDKQNYEIELQRPKFLNEIEQVSNAKRGTLMHLCMQRLDSTQEYNMQEIEDLIQKLVANKIITTLEAQSINKSKILNFCKSTIWKELKTAKQIEKEKPFYINIPICEIYEINTQKPILVQGIIDLYYINKDDQLVLVDYKTDYVENKNEKILIEKYKTQLELYKKALEEALNRKVDKVYIYSTYLDKEIEI